MDPDSLTSGEAKFVDQYTRHLMVEWCHSALVNGTGIPHYKQDQTTYRDHALAKKWISNKDGRVLSSGWVVASAFLKR